MKQRTVRISPEAENDVLAIYEWIVQQGAPENALAYIERLEAYCHSLALFSERGQRRDDIRANLRIVSFEKSAIIAFAVLDTEVVLLRVFYRGRNWEKQL